MLVGLSPSLLHSVDCCINCVRDDLLVEIEIEGRECTLDPLMSFKLDIVTMQTCDTVTMYPAQWLIMMSQIEMAYFDGLVHSGHKILYVISFSPYDVTIGKGLDVVSVTVD